MRDNELEVHQYCLRCGRKLKNPEAQKIGYGIVCYKKMINNKVKMTPLFKMKR